MGDEWEIFWCGDTAPLTDGTVDADGDLVSNTDEWLAGTDPLNP